MRTLWVVAALSLGLGAQAFAEGKVTLEVTAPGVTQSAPADLTVRVANGTGFPIVLDRLSIPATGPVFDWSEQAYGSLSYDEQANAFIHNRMAQQACRLRSGRAILAPGAEGQWAVPFVLTDAGNTHLLVRLSYYTVDSDALASRIYLPRTVSPIKGEYKPARLQDLTDLAAQPLGGIQFVTRDLPKPRTVEAKLTVRVTEAKLPLDQALARIAVTAQQYDSAKERWLLDTKVGLWVVDPGKADFLPGLGGNAYRFAAAAGESVRFWVPIETLPEEVRSGLRLLIGPRQPEEMMGLHFAVPAAEVPAFAAAVHQLGLQVVVSDFQLKPVLSVRPIKW